MLDAFAIARRIKSRFAKVPSLYATGAVLNGTKAVVTVTTDFGIRYHAVVTPVSGIPATPMGYSHLTGDGKRMDQIKLAALAAKAIAAMARVTMTDEQLEPWHKDGVASFSVTSITGSVFLVEISEFTLDMELDYIRASNRAGA